MGGMKAWRVKRLRARGLVLWEQALPDSGLEEEDLLVLGAGPLHLSPSLRMQAPSDAWVGVGLSLHFKQNRASSTTSPKEDLGHSKHGYDYNSGHRRASHCLVQMLDSGLGEG